MNLESRKEAKTRYSRERKVHLREDMQCPPPKQSTLPFVKPRSFVRIRVEVGGRRSHERPEIDGG